MLQNILQSPILVNRIEREEGCVTAVLYELASCLLAARITEQEVLFSVVVARDGLR